MKFSTNRQFIELTKSIFYATMAIPILIFFGTIAYGSNNSQEKTVTGKVTAADEGGLPGVNVLVKGTSQGTVTDLEGMYSLKVPEEDAILVFSSVGYVSVEVEVGNQTVIDLLMTADVLRLKRLL